MLSSSEKKDFIKINSANQFEISVGYLTDSKKKKKINYTIGIYMFIPRNLGINHATYNKSDFYGDFTSYIRLITPRNDLQSINIKMLGLISNIKENINNPKKIKELSSRLKILLCSYLTNLREFVNKVKASSDINHEQIKVFLAEIETFQSIKEEILSVKSHKPNDELLFLIDSSAEYLSRTT